MCRKVEAAHGLSLIHVSRKLAIGPCCLWSPLSGSVAELCPCYQTRFRWLPASLFLAWVCAAHVLVAVIFGEGTDVPHF